MEANNMKALRETLEECWFIALQWKANETAGITGTTNSPNARSAVDTVLDMESLMYAALTKPPRNCDVGTPAEQNVRFREFCRRMSPCSKCPVRKARSSSDVETPCMILWAQMNNEGDAK